MPEEQVSLKSASLGRDVIVTLLQTEAYNPAAPTHLLLLNDGQEMEHLQVREALEQLTGRNRLRQVLVAGIHAGDRMQEYGTAGIPDVKKRGRKAAEYSRFILRDLLPFLHDYAGTDYFASTAFAGCSLGALSALDIAWHYPDTFDKVGAFSGSFWWRDAHPGKHYSDDKNRIMHQIVRQSAIKPDLRFWFQAGTRDEAADRNRNGIIDAIDDTIDLIIELEKKGYRRPEDIQYMEMVGGRHNTATWASAMPRFLTWAFGK